MNNTALNTSTLSIAKMFIALAFVLGLIFLSAYLYKKLSGSKLFSSKSRIPIHTISSLPLGDKRMLVIVEITGQYYFLGVTAHAINLLTKLDAPVEEKAPDQDETFPSILAKIKSHFDKSAS